MNRLTLSMIQICEYLHTRDHGCIFPKRRAVLPDHSARRCYRLRERQVRNFILWYSGTLSIRADVPKSRPAGIIFHELYSMYYYELMVLRY